ncbi:hypothetical protein LguiB_025860 [Lonicera macranthoides]
MKITYTILLLVLVLSSYIILISIWQQSYNYYYFQGTKVYDVRIINGFTQNSSLPLVIWCRTGEGGDLGGRALQEGDDYAWSVKTNFWKSNNFVCTMKWEKKRKSFEAFKGPRDGVRCGALRKCSWLVKEDGFYFSSDEISWTKEFSWP